jgi:hypothetical protein
MAYIDLGEHFIIFPYNPLFNSFVVLTFDPTLMKREVGPKGARLNGSDGVGA